MGAIRVYPLENRQNILFKIVRTVIRYKLSAIAAQYFIALGSARPLSPSAASCFRLFRTVQQSRVRVSTEAIDFYG